MYSAWAIAELNISRRMMQGKFEQQQVVESAKKVEEKSPIKRGWLLFLARVIRVRIKSLNRLVFNREILSPAERKEPEWYPLF